MNAKTLMIGHKYSGKINDTGEKNNNLCFFINSEKLGRRIRKPKD